MNIILADSSDSQPKEVTFPRSNFFFVEKLRSYLGGN